MPDNKKEKPRKPDETVVGGAFIQGGHPGDDDKHYGGEVVDANGKVLAEFADDQVNDGKPHGKDKDEHKADDKKPADGKNPPAPNPPAK